MFVDFFVNSYKKAINFFAWLFLFINPIICLVIFVKTDFVFGILVAIISFVATFVLEFILIPPVLILFSINEKINKTESCSEDINAANVSKPNKINTTNVSEPKKKDFWDRLIDAASDN